MFKNGNNMPEQQIDYLPKNTLFPSERDNLYNKFRNRIQTDYKLNRSLVSFQANKKEPFYPFILKDKIRYLYHNSSLVIRGV